MVYSFETALNKVIDGMVEMLKEVKVLNII